MLKIKLVLLLWIAYVDCQSVEQANTCAGPSTFICHAGGTDRSTGPPPVHPNGKVLQGRPGKSGSKGMRGAKGQKGEQGAREEIGEKLQQLQRKVERLQQLESDVERLKSRWRSELGWFSPFKRYQYRLTDVPRTWSDSREWCKSQGGDLAAVGMRDANLARTIYDGLPTKGLPHGGRVWIGLSDIEREGTFVWVDGVLGTSSNINWNRGQPDDYGGQEDCGDISSVSHHHINDLPCYAKVRGICEKPL